MFKNAIVRTPCKNMIKGLSSSDLGEPDFELALEQHAAYVKALEACDVKITTLPPDEDLPDSCFVEDTAICTPYCVVLTRPGAETRSDEVQAMAPHIREFYKQVECIEAPGTLEGGDIMMVGHHFYIGLSDRTNEEGAKQLIEILEKYGMTGSVVTLEVVLHLKTGVVYLENNNMLASGEFLSKQEFKQFNLIEVPAEEAAAANCIWVNDRIIMAAGYPETKAKIAALGHEIIEVNMSEYQKIDGGLSCLSLRF